jgi:hypothetical protein
MLICPEAWLADRATKKGDADTPVENTRHPAPSASVWSSITLMPCGAQTGSANALSRSRRHHQGQMIEQLVALVNDSYSVLTRLAGSVAALQEAVQVMAAEMPSRRPKDDDLFGTRH